MYGTCFDNKILNVFIYIIYFSYSEMWISNIYFQYLQTGYNSKFGYIFKFNKKKKAKHLVKISLPKSDTYT